MAPEQVAGDPNLDHRADIYAVGCLAYELLTGTSPFAGKTPQQAMAAHVMEKPVPVSEKRAGVPPALASVVMRCLEKEPSARPQSADEILAALDNVTTGSTQALPLPPRRRSRARTLAIAAAGLAVVLIAAVLIVPRFRTASAADDTLTLAVAPFEVLDPSLSLWKEGIVDVLSRNLDGAGPIRTVSPSLAIKKGDGRIDAGSAASFAQRVSARLVVYGILQPAGTGMVRAQVSVFDRSSGRRTADFDQTDSTARMDRLTDNLSLRLLSAIGLSGQGGAPRSLGTTSLPAIRAFLQGQQYFRRTQWDSAAAAFEQAVSHDSSFGVAYMFLGQSLGWSRAGSAEGTRAYLRAGQLIRGDLAPRDSLALEAVSHYVKAQRQGMIVQSEARAAVAAAQAAVDRYPNDAMT
jgi:eukaryotic-like serine/threonine-protein kinase